MKLFNPVKFRVALIALILSPTVFANSDGALSQEPITLRMKEIPLSKLVYVFSLSQGLNILNSEVVSDDILIKVDLNNVPADEIFANILRCGGLGYVQYESGIELILERHWQGDFKCSLEGDGEVELGKLLRER